MLSFHEQLQQVTHFEFGNRRQSLQLRTRHGRGIIRELRMIQIDDTNSRSGITTTYFASAP